MPPEIVLARWLALCVHPLAAWRRLPLSGRILVLASYSAAAYLVVLTALLSL